MNHTNDNHDSGLGNAIDRVAREFEKRWHQDHSFVIEDFLDSIDQLVSPFRIDTTKPEYRDAIMAELIHLEMDLRCAHRHPFQPDEYFDRFREIPNAVVDALDRVRQLYPHCFRGSVLRTTKTRIGDESESEGSFWIIEAAGHTEVHSELGPYREITYIGSGGFGDVYKAIDTRIDETVALKFPKHRHDSSSAELEQVKAEAEMAMRLSHSGIVSTRAIENIDTYAFIVQDYVDGMDLKKFIQKAKLAQQEMTQRDVGLLVALVADALAYAHREGIIHRDIKPQNILIDKSGKPFVADFGLAIHSNQRYETIGQPVCGTKYYFSPEVVSGRMYQVGGFYDMWSLGIVFYQLLTEKRPFGGPNDKILFEEIAQKDPEPPHVLNHRVDPELDRLCLQCLEKKPGRRLTARKLADSLQGWLKQPPAKKRTDERANGPPPKFVPRGLHSYTARDAPFFLRLLPGPRDEHGIPASIRFWRDRILEPVAQEDRVPVGVIYGPSGCGKSSYVKAGLIPLIDHQVKCLYVESTHADTDVRLLRALRHEFDIPSDQTSLPEIFAGLQEGNWQKESRKKILICLDQFEQRLSAVGEFDPTELVNALRHCDGENLQCLLLVRDDFLMSMSRFADALEMDLREGQNTQIVDLFDRKHAQKILTMLGHAYDRLSSDNIDELSAEEVNFVNRAVDDQVEDHHVICVRLSVFAEMFKNQPWSVANLQDAGSVAGVGVQFLDRELGPQNRKVSHQAAFRLLCSLLPAAGTDIRGAMKGETELAVAAGLPIESTTFKKVIALLDGELRLITRSDPDVSGVVEGDRDNSKSGDRHFQLTHDYLVPSIRAWQDKWLGGTRRGRAELRLQRLASEVIAGKPPENLPTHLEWLAWKVLLRRHRFTSNEQMLMRSARRRFLKDTSVAATILIVVGGLISWALVKQSRDQYAATLIARIKDLNYSGLPDVVEELRDYESRVVPVLHKMLERNDSSVRQRALLGLLPFESHYVEEIVTNIVRPDCGPEELAAATLIASNCNAPIDPYLKSILANQGVDPRSRFRAICALVLQCAEQDDWTQNAGMMVNLLCDEPLTAVDKWVEVLKPISEQLNPTLSRIFETSNDGRKAAVLARALFAINPDNIRIQKLVSFVPNSNEARFDAILSTIEQNGASETFVDELEQLSFESNIVADANISLALMRLGKEKRLIALYSGNFESVATILAINLSTAGRLRLHSLRQLYVNHSIGHTDNQNLRRSLLQALALQSSNVFDPTLKSWLTEIARDHVVRDPDACCFSTAELILKRLGLDSIEVLREQRRENSTSGILGNVFIDNCLMAFSIVSKPNKDNSTSLFAISTTEVTNRDVHKFLLAKGTNAILNQPNHPNEVENFQMVYYYCNWLSKENNLAEDFLCYPSDVKLQELQLTPADACRGGYRIPTVEEWLVANESNRVLEGLVVDGSAVSLNYAWVLENSNNKVQETGRLLPNATGLFDSFGNVQEICEDTNGKELNFFEKGLTVRVDASLLSVDFSAIHYVVSPIKTRQGFRLVRSLE